MREFENPLEVLAWQAGAGADQVLDEHAPRGVGIAELERRVHLRDGLLPIELLRIHQPRQQKRRQRLRVGSGDEQRVLVDGIGLAELADAQSPLEHHLAAIDEAERDPGHAELFHTAFEKRFDVRDALGVERVRSASGEGLPLVAFRPQALRDERERCGASLECGFGSVDDEHGPRGAGAVGDRLHDRALVRRGLVLVNAPRVPAVARRSIRGELQRPFRVRLVNLPGGRNRGVSIRSLHVDDDDVRIRFRGLEHDHRVGRTNRPTGGRGETRAAGRRQTRISRYARRRLLSVDREGKTAQQNGDGCTGARESAHGDPL